MINFSKDYIKLISKYSQKVDKVGCFKYQSSQNSRESWKSYDSSLKNLSIQSDNSIISSTIHGKTSKKIKWMNWYHVYSSKEDFSSLLLHIPSNREITVHLKYYPAQPIDGNIMIDYELKFDRYNMLSEALSLIF